MRRMFVDPGTNVTGWALFDDDELVDSGTISAMKGPAFRRLLEIGKAYARLASELQPDQVYFERMNRIVHVSVIWSIGTIGYAIKRAHEAAEIMDSTDSQISPSSWKKYDKETGAYNIYRPDSGSDDETVAILLGLVYLKNMRGNNNG